MLSATNFRGVTLIELAIGIVIIGILLLTGAPSYIAWINNSQIRTAAESIINGIQLTRAEAVRQNTSVQFSLTGLPMSDWAVSVAGSAIQSRSGREGSANARVATPPASAVTVTFNGLGRVTTNADLSTSLTQANVTSTSTSATRTLRVLVSGGTVRMCDPDPALAISNPPNPQSCSF